MPTREELEVQLDSEGTWHGNGDGLDLDVERECVHVGRKTIYCHRISSI